MIIIRFREYVSCFYYYTLVLSLMALLKTFYDYSYDYFMKDNTRIQNHKIIKKKSINDKTYANPILMFKMHVNKDT